MSFCCGAGMIGTIGSVHAGVVFIHDIPLLYCPVCHSVKIHPGIEDEYQILLEYAIEDRASEVVFSDFVDIEGIEGLKDFCSSWDEGNPERLLREQIDLSLDLMVMAKAMQDEVWEEQLKRRLKALSHSLERWNRLKSLYA